MLQSFIPSRNVPFARRNLSGLKHPAGNLDSLSHSLQRSPDLRESVDTSFASFALAFAFAAAVNFPSALALSLKRFGKLPMRRCGAVEGLAVCLVAAADPIGRAPTGRAPIGRAAYFDVGLNFVFNELEGILR